MRAASTTLEGAISAFAFIHFQCLHLLPFPKPLILRIEGRFCFCAVLEIAFSPCHRWSSRRISRLRLPDASTGLCTEIPDIGRPRNPGQP
jgi:hypothetical protein